MKVARSVLRGLPSSDGRWLLDECINKKPVIRSRVRDSIFVHISENDDTGRLLSGLHHNHDVEPLIDSETREDSEQPPKPK